MKNFVKCRICNKKFKRITPTHLKTHNITVKKYQDRFGYDPSVLSSDSLRKKFSNTKESIIKKYGEIEGTKRWISYCDKQRISNTFEYKSKKHGWTKEDFDNYNKSRAVTKELCIKRHGKKNGIKLWNDYVEKQKYVGVKKEYFIEKYGVKNGIKKYEDMLRSKIYKPNKINNGIYYSKSSYDMFKLLDKDNSEFVFYAGKNNEYILNSGSIFYALDYFDARTNKAIEFNGDYWHCNPTIYDENYLHKQINKTAKEIWNEDNTRINIIKNMFNIDTLIIWESDYTKDKNKILTKCLEFLND